MPEMSEADAAIIFAEFEKGRSNGQASAAGSLGEWNAGDDPGPIPPREWLLGNQFCRGFISSLFAAGGVGKSALRLLQIISLATGRSLCGQHVFRRCRVLLISLEDDDNELQRRIAAILLHFNLPRSDLDGWLFCACPIGQRLAEHRGRDRIIGDLQFQIRNAIDRRRPDLVAIDPFVKLHDLAENDSGDMNFVCNLLVRIAIETNIAVDVPHHVHKGMIIAGDADAGRGSSGIRDAGRLIYTLTPMTEDEAETFDIGFDKRLSYVRLDSAKVNITERSGEAVWFHIVGVPLNNKTAEYPAGDTIQVVEPWKPPDAWADMPESVCNKALDNIERGILDDGLQPTGELYSNENAARARAAWKVIKLLVPDKPDKQCKTVITKWVNSGLLVEVEYQSKNRGELVKGLKVNNSKRPGAKTEFTL